MRPLSVNHGFVISIFRSTRAGTPATTVYEGHPCHHAPRPNHSPFPNRHTAQDRGIAPNRKPAAGSGWEPAPNLPGFGHCRRGWSNGILVIDEHHPMADEDLVFDGHPLADETVAGYLTRLPILAPRWISTNVPILDSSPISQPYR